MRPIIGRDYHGRTRTPRTMEEAFGTRGGLHAGRHRRNLDPDILIGGALMVAVGASAVVVLLVKVLA